MTKLKELLNKIQKTSDTTSVYYYGYIHGARCYEKFKKFIRISTSVLPSPIPEVEIVFIRQESRMDITVWKGEAGDKLYECIHEKSSGTSWTSIGGYIAILKDNQLFFSEISGMRKWTINKVSFEENFAIISGDYDYPYMMPNFGEKGFQPGDMGYFKKDYELKIPQINKIPL